MNDVFLSYSWAGNDAHPDLGEKGWVARFQQALESALTERMDRRASVFIDSQQRSHGYFTGQLREAVRSARVFLFVVTEWSCRPESWCHREVQTFLDSARPIHGFTKPFTDRLAKVILRPPVLNPEPGALRAVLAKNFGVRDSNGLWRRFDGEDLFHDETEAAKRLNAMADDLAKLLRSIDEAEGRAVSQPGEDQTVFLGCGSPGTADHRSWLREDFTRKGYTVIAHSPVAHETEEEFHENSLAAMREADVSIHLIGEQERAPDHWEAAPGEWQLRRAAEGLGKRGAWVYVWQDPMTATAGPTLLRTFQERWALAENTEWIDNPSSAREKKTIQHLASNVEDRLQRRPLAETPPLRTPEVRWALLHCDRKDDTDAGAVIADLESRNIKVKISVRSGSKMERETWNRSFSQNCHGSLILYGAAQYPWALRACQEIETWAGGARAKPAAVLLAPPPEDPRKNLEKRQFDPPGFDIIPRPGESRQEGLNRFAASLWATNP